jgi:hypothetical protein
MKNYHGETYNMSNVSKPQVAKVLAYPVKNQVSSMSASTPLNKTETARPPALKSGSKSDIFNPANNLFIGTLQAETEPGTLAKATRNDSTRLGRINQLPTDPLPPTEKGEVYEIVKDVKLDTGGMTAAEIQTAKDYIIGLSKDEDGAKLIKNATKDAPITVVFDPSYGDGVGAAYIPGGANQIRLSKRTLQNEQKNGDPNDPMNIMGMGALAHEFVHAALDGSGNSQQEEAIGSTLGARIAGRYYGKPLDQSEEQHVYNEWMKMISQSPTYARLQFDNSVVDRLNEIGITFNDLKLAQPPQSPPDVVRGLEPLK